MSENPDLSTGLEEGRRLYLGNLSYHLTAQDIQLALGNAGFPPTRVHISTDAMSGKSPGYCFIEYTSRDQADAALTSLPGLQINDRPVKIGPGQRKRTDGQARNRTDGRELARPWQRGNSWTHWKGSTCNDGRADASTSLNTSPSQDQSTARTIPWTDHVAENEDQEPFVGLEAPIADSSAVRPHGDPRTLHVAGLPRMPSSEVCERELRALFAGYEM